MIEKQAETQLIPTAETASSQSRVETEVGGSGIKVDLHTITEPQRDSVPNSPSYITQESETVQPTTPDTVRTTGDRWNEVISEKRQNLPPRVL
jgi:hypothetical protein